MLTRRLGVIAVSGALSLGLLGGTAAAETNCLRQVIGAEQEVYGTAWGREAVSVLARNPGLFEGAGNLGEVARLLARTASEDCPVP